MKNVLYKEKHKFDDNFSLVVLGVFCLGALAGGANALFRTNQNILVAIILFLVALALGFLMWWLTRLQLKVEFNSKTIKFKMSPIHLSKKAFLWKDIENYGIIETSKAEQWSGGNITFKQEKRISLTGRNGLALKTKEGAYYLIGCHEIEKLRAALDKLDQK